MIKLLDILQEAKELLFQCEVGRLEILGESLIREK